MRKSIGSQAKNMAMLPVAFDSGPQDWSLPFAKRSGAYETDQRPMQNRVKLYKLKNHEFE